MQIDSLVFVGLYALKKKSIGCAGFIRNIAIGRLLRSAELLNFDSLQLRLISLISNPVVAGFLRIFPLFCSWLCFQLISANLKGGCSSILFLVVSIKKTMNSLTPWRLGSRQVFELKLLESLALLQCCSLLAFIFGSPRDRYSINRCGMCRHH